VTVLGSIRTSSTIWKANSWYRLEVDWGTNDAIVGKLFDSSGTKLLASLTSGYTVTGSGGIAFSATGSGSKYFDTVQMVPARTATAIHPLPFCAGGPIHLGTPSLSPFTQPHWTSPSIVFSAPASTKAGLQVVIAVPAVNSSTSASPAVPGAGAD